MKETSVERRLIRESRALGGECFKMLPVVAGIPDRCVMLPGGHIYFVETKAPNGEVRPAQKVWHDRAWSRCGIRVWLIWDGPMVTSWLADRMAEITAEQ